MLGKLKTSIMDLLRRLFKMLLFLSSYSPLFTIMLIQSWNSALVTPLLCLIGMPWFALRLFLSNQLEPNCPLVVTKRRRKGSESMNYVVGYIIPFLSLNLPLVGQEGQLIMKNALSLLILFSVLGNIYISNGLYYINPLLTLKYHVDEVETCDGSSVFLITPNRIAAPYHGEFMTTQMAPDVYLYHRVSRI